MNVMRAAIALTSLFLTSCSSFLVGPSEQPPTVDVDEESAPQRLDRFAGTWVVDQPFHAGYEASWYELDRSGALQHLRTDDFGGGLVTGFDQVGTATIVGVTCGETASECDSEISCGFSDQWRSDGADTLIIDGECDDGQAREIELRFMGEASGDAAGITAVEVVRVGDVTGRVGHRNYEWRFVKCADANGAALSDSWECSGLDGA